MSIVITRGVATVPIIVQGPVVEVVEAADRFRRAGDDGKAPRAQRGHGIVVLSNYAVNRVGVYAEFRLDVKPEDVDAIERVLAKPEGT